ncbi:hypothetical protein J6590_057269 [Homalodisca vitripennis]|nr:hypothetical protein J6590_057269 [Homalodisca vitripennis]
MQTKPTNFRLSFTSELNYFAETFTALMNVSSFTASRRYSGHWLDLPTLTSSRRLQEVIDSQDTGDVYVNSSEYCGLLAHSQIPYTLLFTSFTLQICLP